ncbi:RBP11-like subunits of RNA polymerase [Lophiostoma macrostomum CBS 122681]|uniref:DNA-directed RNA polymerases I and III subunit RPAC1 n=1 Tax=Lophiostoma macrostomum CBS 122681 TaxID=1314788 RepID=A0A6A6SQQ2_9PLEO|nr:RBP11-like subunits of RNA polymerase [Lophiostoma macrostomum CBS 122681]
MPAPTQEELERRKRLEIKAETVGNAASTDFPHHWPGEDHEWSLDYFKDSFQVRFHNNSTHDSEFSLIGLDTSVANAFRRIMIAEVESLAIEDVFIYQNTSIMQDEILAHRLGLIPLKGDPAALKWLQWYRKPVDDQSPAAGFADFNTVLFTLKKTCTWQEGGKQRFIAGETDPEKLYEDYNVYAGDIVYHVSGKQSDFGAENLFEVVNPDILILKMRPGQEIALVMHARKGIGQDHAKFSPVATASYRLLPTIDILKPIVGEDAKKFARCFPRGVIKLEPVSEEDVQKDETLQGKEGEIKAVVANPMRDTVSRECLRHPEFKDKVKLGRVRDHFIFRVESTGQWESDEIFLESVRLLKGKAQRLRNGLDELMS